MHHTFPLNPVFQLISDQWSNTLLRTLILNMPKKFFFPHNKTLKIISHYCLESPFYSHDIEDSMANTLSISKYSKYFFNNIF